ncbi:MAG: FAD-dependent oxidoreductase, partial [Sphingobium sp.]
MVHVPTTMNMSDPLGHVTDKIIGAYESIAAGGSAATIVGATCVRWDGLINERMLGMYDDTYVIGHRDLVDVIRGNNSLSGIQLFYGGMIPGLGTTIPLKDGQGWIPNTVAWGPSNAVIVGNPKPGIVSEEVYDTLVEDYAQAARRCREAGYDFISFHFCHGSLPHTNLSLLANVGRNDKYADHFLFCELILKRTQELCGKDFPIIPRLCCDENLEGGYDIEYFAEHFAPRLHEIGIAVLDCTFGSMVQGKSRNPEIPSTEYIGPGFYTPNMVNLENIAKLRSLLTAKGIDTPLIGSAQLGAPDHLRAMVSDGHADLAGVCRLSMDDPDYANKIIEGRPHEIRKSTRTGASLLQGNIFGKGWAGSAQNPAFGRDRDYRIRPTAEPKKVVIVGGGSGGMEYAITAKRIGHEVVLLEKTQTLGGAMDWAGNYKKIPNMEIIRFQPDYHRIMMEKYKVPYRLGVEADVETILAEKPDVVVIATGARSLMPSAAGLEDALASGFAVTLETAMARDDAFDPGDSPLIYGASIAGELAVDYAMRGLRVRLLDGKPGYVPVNYLGSRGPRVTQQLAQNAVHVEGGRQIVRVGAGEVEVVHDDGVREVITASSLVLAPDRAPDYSLEMALQGKGVVVQIIGDARQPRSYGNAIHEAAYLARNING